MFAYAANNPVKYADPDGRDIEINNDQEKILTFINKYSYYRYKIDEQNHLVRDGDKINPGNTSKKYSAVIDAAINNHSKTIIIIISDKSIRTFSNGNKIFNYDVESEGGGGVTSPVSDSLKLIAITGQLSKPILMKNFRMHRYTPEEVLMHELVGHAIPMLFDLNGGSAIFNENTIRKELGLDERLETYNDPVVKFNFNAKFLFMPNK